MVSRHLTVGVLISAFLFVFCGFAASAEEGQPAAKAQKAKPAAERPAQAQQAPSPAPTAVTVTLEELKRLLDRKQTPRVAVATKFTTITGKAVKIDKGKLFIDVTAEKVALAGTLGVSLSRTTSITVLAELSQAELKAAREATAKYLADLERAAAEAAAEAAAKAEAPKGPESTAVEPAPKEQKEAGKRDLLDIYPPSEGWGPARLAEITRKRVVLGLNPFDKDRDFLKDYDAWRIGYLAERDRQLQQKAAWETAGQKAPEGFEILPELGPVPSLAGTPWGENEGVESPAVSAE